MVILILIQLFQDIFFELNLKNDNEELVKLKNELNKKLNDLKKNKKELQ
jgi:hypothetical protein